MPDATQSHEVDANEALLQDTGADQAPDVEEDELEPLDHGDVVDILKPKVNTRQQILGVEGQDQRAFFQKELSPLAKMQLFGLVGDVMDKALSGENAMTVGHLFEAPGNRGGELKLEDFREADTFVQAVAKLVKYSPTFIADSFAILYDVDDENEAFFKFYIRKGKVEGGIDDEEFSDIIETFIDQNWRAIDIFFREKVARIRKRANQQIENKKGQSSASSTRSRTTPQPTGATR